jgi:hypothetical protein
VTQLCRPGSRFPTVSRLTGEGFIRSGRRAGAGDDDLDAKLLSLRDLPALGGYAGCACVLFASGRVRPGAVLASGATVARPVRISDAKDQPRGFEFRLAALLALPGANGKSAAATFPRLAVAYRLSAVAATLERHTPH